MNYHFQVSGWVIDPDPINASKGCGMSQTECFNIPADTPAKMIAHAHFLMLRKHPTFHQDSMRIRCNALDINQKGG